MVKIEINIEEVLRENKDEFLSWATGDEDFVRSFSKLIITHWSEQGSYPSKFEQIRSEFLKGIGEDLASELQDKVIRLQQQIDAKNSEERRLSNAARTIYEFLPQIADALKHEGDGQSCQACKFVRSVKEFYCFEPDTVKVQHSKAGE